jgi:hypothetical protein
MRFENFIMEASVRESALPSLVAKVAAKYADPSGDDSRLSYTIRSGNGQGLFSIDNEDQCFFLLPFSFFLSCVSPPPNQFVFH